MSERQAWPKQCQNVRDKHTTRVVFTDKQKFAMEFMTITRQACFSLHKTKSSIPLNILEQWKNVSPAFLVSSTTVPKNGFSNPSNVYVWCQFSCKLCIQIGKNKFKKILKQHFNSGLRTIGPHCITSPSIKFLWCWGTNNCNTNTVTYILR